MPPSSENGGISTRLKDACSTRSKTNGDPDVGRLANLRRKLILTSILPTSAVDATLSFLTDPFAAVLALYRVLDDGVIASPFVDARYTVEGQTDAKEVD